MKTFATKEKRSVPMAHKARSYIHHPSGPVLQARQTVIRNILRADREQANSNIGEQDNKSGQGFDQPVTDRIPVLSSQTPAEFSVGSPVQRQPENEEETLQAKSNIGGLSVLSSKLESGINRIKGGGQPLDSTSRAFLEPRFGQDFSGVRVHQGDNAAELSRSINARAFTLGNDIVFGSGVFQPGSQSGKRLLAHELTHVIQQSDGKKTQKSQLLQPMQSGHSDSQVIHRDLIDDLRERAEEEVKERLRNLANQPVGPGGWTGAGSGCHVNFCKPFTSMSSAITDLAWAGPLILTGIATEVNRRVVPLWARYIAGGSGVQNLSGSFAIDFSNSPTTLDTTRFLIRELRALIETEHATLMGSAPTITIDVSSHLLAARRAINTPQGADEMNFNVPTDIAGNIAGGIGADQSAHSFGSRPSPINDSRTASISVTLIRNPSGTITVIPSIRYRVSDTIDLCPGDCGNSDEQVATVPLSRFEATGLVGDVPIIIDFDAPASELVPFTVTPTSSPSVYGETTASALRYRSAPNTSATILGRYSRGTRVELLCQTTGTVVLGVNKWYMTSDGFISGRYVSLVGSVTPPSC